MANAERKQQDVPSITRLGSACKTSVTEERYSKYFRDYTEDSEVSQHRKENAKDMTEDYYDLVTDFYEYGYGQSFHFAPVFDNLSMGECLVRYEKGLGEFMKAKPGMTLLDAGCGVGGPGREIARSFGSKVVGLNCSGYQLGRAALHTQKANLKDLCSYVKGDFCQMPFEDNSFDGSFAIESICHSKDPTMVYKEICRVLKPGAVMTESAWAMTDSFDPENSQHVSIRNGIMLGNSLPEIRTQKHLIECIRKAGLEVVEFRDTVKDSELPWETFLTGRNNCIPSVQNFRTSTIGRWATHFFLTALELIGMAPKGSTKVHSILLEAADSLIASTKADIFTPMFRIVARKPLES